MTFCSISGDVEIRSFAESLSLLLSYDLDCEFVFRGQADATWSLCPSIFRGPKGRALSVSARRAKIRSFGNYLVDFCDVYSRYGEAQSDVRDWSEPEKLALAQHYGFPTLALDWSESPLVALFMALSFWQVGMGNLRVFAVRKESFEVGAGAVLLDVPRRFDRIWTQRGFLSVVVDKTIAETSAAERAAYFLDEIVDEKLYFEAEIFAIDIKMDESEARRARRFLERNRLSFRELFPRSLHWAVRELVARHEL